MPIALLIAPFVAYQIYQAAKNRVDKNNDSAAIWVILTLLMWPLGAYMAGLRFKRNGLTFLGLLIFILSSIIWGVKTTKGLVASNLHDYSELILVVFFIGLPFVLYLLHREAIKYSGYTGWRAILWITLIILFITVPSSIVVKLSEDFQNGWLITFVTIFSSLLGVGASWWVCRFFMNKKICEKWQKLFNMEDDEIAESEISQNPASEKIETSNMILELTGAENSIYNDYKEMIQSNDIPNMAGILAKLKKKHKLNIKYITNAIEKGEKYETSST